MTRPSNSKRIEKAIRAAEARKSFYKDHIARPIDKLSPSFISPHSFNLIYQTQYHPPFHRESLQDQNKALYDHLFPHLNLILTNILNSSTLDVYFGIVRDIFHQSTKMAQQFQAIDGDYSSQGIKRAVQKYFEETPPTVVITKEGLGVREGHGNTIWGIVDKETPENELFIPVDVAEAAMVCFFNSFSNFTFLSPETVQLTKPHYPYPLLILTTIYLHEATHCLTKKLFLGQKTPHLGLNIGSEFGYLLEEHLLGGQVLLEWEGDVFHDKTIKLMENVKGTILSCTENGSAKRLKIGNIFS